VRRLHVQIFLTFLGVVVLFGVLVSAAWWIGHDDEDERRATRALRALIEEALPPPSAPPDHLEAVLARLGGKAGAHMTVRDGEGDVLGAFGPPLADPAPRREGSGWRFGRDKTVGMVLSDGRRVIVRPTGEGDRGGLHGFGFLAVLLCLVVAIAVGAYPLARRLTRRLERLQAQADKLGAGDLSARVRVEGRDEVAALARSFNRAADQIQKLVAAQKQTLAAASHELRTPLARLRMAFELLAQPGASAESAPELRARVERDIAELDDLIEELLLASRLDAAPDRIAAQEIDLLGLAAEESARYDAAASGSPCVISGDERLLRRLIRNLLENARRHGGGTPAEILVEPGSGTATLRVINRGPPVPEGERERIFAPFYRPRGLSEEGKGFGLGLFLVRQIARLHGGEARCLAYEGGTCFEVTLAVKGASCAGANPAPGT
jgi:signal transduction histidine kinase